MTTGFTVPGQPVPMGRPRVTCVGGRPRAYTPAKTREYVARVAAACSGVGPIDGPVAVTVMICMARPKSMRGGRREWHARRPDIDNIIKAILDGMVAGGVLADDGQVAAMAVEMVYAAHGEEPHADVSVRALGVSPA